MNNQAISKNDSVSFFRLPSMATTLFGRAHIFKILSFAAPTLMSSVILCSCGGSEDLGQDNSLNHLLADTYQEQPEDVVTTSTSMNIRYSNGRTVELSKTSVMSYSEVESIPSSYTYSNRIAGPYILETTTEDGVLDSLEYMSLLGERIIDDNLDYFTSEEHSDIEGSEEPENILIGDVYHYYADERLFASSTASDIGYKITNMTITIVSKETIEVPAGKFDAVKVHFSSSGTKSVNGVVDTSTGQGDGWLDTTTGMALRTDMEAATTLNEYGVSATITASEVLQSYSLSLFEENATANGVAYAQPQIRAISLARTLSDFVITQTLSVQ